jgi:two-component system, NarL family, sensor kinase
MQSAGKMRGAGNFFTIFGQTSRIMTFRVWAAGVLFTYFICSPCFAQGQSTSDIKLFNDSAQLQLDHGQVAKAKIWLEKIAFELPGPENAEQARAHRIKGDMQEAEGFFRNADASYRQSLKIASSIAEPALQARAINGIASTAIALAKYDSVQYLLQKTLALDSSRANQVAHHLLAGRFWQTQNQYDKALPFFQQANDKAKLLGDRRQRALALSGMAGIYFSQEPDMKRTLSLFSEAVSLLDSSRHANVIARTYARMANANMVLGNGQEAERYLMRAKKITDLSGNLPVKSYVLSSLAILKSEQGKIKEAAEFAEEPLRIKRELGQLAQLQNDLLNLSEWYMYLKKFTQARNTLTEGLATSTALKDVVYLQYFHERLAQLDSITGNYQDAYSHLKRASVYKDSAVSLKRIQTVEQLREQYETEQKEKIIAEKELEIQNHRYQQAIVIGASGLAVLILVVVLVMIRNRHRIKLEKEKQRQHHLRLQTIVHTQEEVQQSIARDIHDGLVQIMGAAKLSLQTISPQSEKATILNRVQEASAIMDDACTEARQISHQLLPYSLMKDGLVPALEELLRKSFNSFDFNKPVEVNRLGGDVEINLYRIAQELVNNTLRHAEASHVIVDLSMERDTVNFSYRDDGKGFSINAAARGVGLTNIVTRATLIGGTAEIVSQPGKGILVRISSPL